MAKRFGKAIFILQALTLIVLMRVCFTLSPPEKRPRLPRSSSGCTLTLYDGNIGSSSSLELTTSNSSLADNGWDNRASSAVVSGGCQWILYDEADFAENISSPVSPSLIGPGSYPWSYWTTFGLPNNALSAVRCLPAVGTPAIALFRHHHYFGVMQVLNSSNPNLALINFDNLVSSLVITGGVWELYSEANYTGSIVTLGPGLYPTPFFLTPIVNDNLRSVRLTVFADCGPPLFLLNGAVSYQATTEGSEGRYQCNDGFTLEGGMTTVCGANGSWDSIPFCRPHKADCGPPSVFLNGTVSYQNTTEESEAQYHCDDGFTLEGGMTAVCRADGRWSFPPVCRPLTADCGHPPVFRNGTVNYWNTTVGSEAQYHCDDGFTLEGEMTAVCRADGRWSSTPVCRQTTGGSSNSSERIEGIGTTTITAITIPLSCVVSFIVGALAGAVVHYCAVRRKKHAKDVRKKPTVVLSQLTEETDTKYEDISDLQSPGNIDLKENAAYAHVQH